MLIKLILWAAHHFLWAGTVGLFGIGMGPSSQEKSQYGDIGNLANFATTQGEGDISTADNFWRSILSGDPTQISKVLGPAISGINKRGQESKMTTAQFGNRGGGTNASMQMTDDTTRSSVDSLISSLTGKAADALGASGSSLLSTGLSAHTAAFSAADTIQKQRSAQINDIFKSIASLAAAPFTGGASLTGLAGGPPGGGGGMPSFGGPPGSSWNNPDYGITGTPPSGGDWWS
jgi:hypothetical protein